MGLVSELRRRNVFRVAIAYVIIAWLTLQVGDTLAPSLHLDDWVNSALVFFLILGFPLAIFFAWAYELTPEGIKLEKHVNRSQSITHITGRKFDYLIIAALAFALGYFAFDKFVLDPSRDADLVRTTTEAVTEQAVETADYSIAVLPFVNMSSDPEQEYFSDGISEELLNALVHVDGLRVASRTSSFTFRGENKNLEEIANALSVSYVLEGSVRKAGNQVRITAQLIEVTSDRNLWSEIFDRDLTDIFAIQNEIANAIVAALKESLDIGVTSEIVISAATTNMNAYVSYLQAHELFFARAKLEKSIMLFEQSVAMDPEFARAWEGLAAAYSIMPSWGHTDRDYKSLALEAAQTALQLDDGLSLAYSVIGAVYSEPGYHRWRESFENFGLAARNDRKNTTNLLWRAINYMELGYFELAMSDLDQCLSIDPNYGNCHRFKANVHLMRGERDDGIDLYLRGLESGISGPQPMFVSALALSGNRVAALLLADRTTGRTGAPIVEWVNLIEDADTDRGDALDVFDRWLEPRPRDVNIIPMALAFGTYDRITSESSVAYLQSIWLPEFANFRQSPQFKRVVSELNMQLYWRSHGFPHQCRPIGDDDFECE